MALPGGAGGDPVDGSTAVEALLGLALTRTDELGIGRQGFGELGVAKEGGIGPRAGTGSSSSSSSSGGRLVTKRGRELDDKPSLRRWLVNAGLGNKLQVLNHHGCQEVEDLVHVREEDYADWKPREKEQFETKRRELKSKERHDDNGGGAGSDMGCGGQSAGQTTGFGVSGQGKLYQSFSVALPGRGKVGLSFSEGTGKGKGEAKGCDKGKGVDVQSHGVAMGVRLPGRVEGGLSFSKGKGNGTGKGLGTGMGKGKGRAKGKGKGEGAQSHGGVTGWGMLDHKQFKPPRQTQSGGMKLGMKDTI